MTSNSVVDRTRQQGSTAYGLRATPPKAMSYATGKCHSILSTINRSKDRIHPMVSTGLQRFCLVVVIGCAFVTIWNASSSDPFTTYLDEWVGSVSIVSAIFSLIALFHPGWSMATTAIALILSVGSFMGGVHSFA